MFKVGDRVTVDMTGFAAGGVSFPGSGSTMVGIITNVLQSGINYEVELPLRVAGTNRFVFAASKLQLAP